MRNAKCNSNLLIAGDIGGTNARFAAFETSPGLRMLQKVWLKTSDFGRFDDLLDALSHGELKDFIASAQRFVFAVAGPVVEGTTAKLSNVSWQVDVTQWRRTRGNCVALINDFVAQAFAVKTSVIANASQVIKPGDAETDGLVSVIGAGTGLGHCSILTLPSGDLAPVPSEAAHQAFAFREGERDFEKFARQELGVEYITSDMIVSGRGLSLLHEFFHHEELPPAEVASRLTEDSPVLTTFARFYGRACRHYAFAVLPTGGIYLAGGVAARNPILVTAPAFTEEFLSAIKHRKLLERIPIRLNAEQDSGLWGAARNGMGSQSS